MARAFDWLAFLKARRIEWVEEGHTKGNVGVHCPWCGNSDQGFHLGIHLGGKGWYCWRNRGHRGRRPHRLVQALLGCSWLEVETIIGDGPGLSDIDDLSFGKHIQGVLSGAVAERKERRDRLTFPSEMKQLHDCSEGIGRLFVGYLCQRGYSRREVEELCALYELHYAMKGDFTYRVIFPLWMHRELTTWTGRSISPIAEPKYRTLTSNSEKAEEGKPLARQSIKDCLWNFDDLIEDPKHALIVCEGPFDAMRVDYYGFDCNMRATCLFGKSISDEQLLWLEDIGELYPERYLALDPDASLDVLATMDRCRYIGFKPLRLPTKSAAYREGYVGKPDPAELTPRAIRSLLD